MNNIDMFKVYTMAWLRIIDNIAVAEVADEIEVYMIGNDNHA
jgi:hypothetical protein